MDKIEAMRAFVTVVEQKSFAAAGRSLERSTPMVSKLVQALEASLGVRLLNRTTRRLSLTDTGRGYYERCVAILGDVEEADAAAASAAALPRGVLRVNAPVSFGRLRVVPLLADFHRRYPEVVVDLVLNDRRVDVVEEGFDVVIRVGAVDDSSLVARPLGEVATFVCAAPAYLRRRGRPRLPADLARHDCLCYTYASGASRDVWTFEKDGHTTQVRVAGPLRANNGDALQHAALDGLGVIYQPAFLAAPDIEAGRLVDLFPGYRTHSFPVHAIYPHRRHLSAKVRAWVEFLSAGWTHG